MIKICKICGKKYKTYHRKQKTCGKTCGHKSRLKNLPPQKPEHLEGLKNYTKSIKGKSYEEIYGKKGKKKLKKNMKGVWTLNWFISKYGKREGERKYKERSKQISKKSYFREYNKTNRENFSKTSQKLFWQIYRSMNLIDQKVYFAELNHEFSCHCSHKLFDFVLEDDKKVIEFNGDSWHGNPEIYSENDVPNSIIGKTAKELWEQDREKIDLAKQKGYEVLVVWEKDYRENPKKCLQECVNFLHRDKSFSDK